MNRLFSATNAGNGWCRSIEERVNGWGSPRSELEQSASSVCLDVEVVVAKAEAKASCSIIFLSGTVSFRGFRWCSWADASLDQQPDSEHGGDRQASGHQKDGAIVARHKEDGAR